MLIHTPRRGKKTGVPVRRGNTLSSVQNDTVANSMKTIYHLTCTNTLFSLNDSIDFSAAIVSVLISEMDLSGRWNIFGPYGLRWHMMKSHCCRWMICCIKLIIARVMLLLPAMRKKDNMRSLDERLFDGRRSWLMWRWERVFRALPVSSL